MTMGRRRPIMLPIGMGLVIAGVGTLSVSGFHAGDPIDRIFFVVGSISITIGAGLLVSAVLRAKNRKDE